MLSHLGDGEKRIAERKKQLTAVVDMSFEQRQLYCKLVGQAPPELPGLLAAFWQGLMADCSNPMSTREDFSNLLHATFSAQPMPARFFWKEGVHDTSDEFCRDLLERLWRREWTEIKMSDWVWIGSAISMSRAHLEPATFLYYLPSLLLGVIEEPEYLELALEAIIPLGRDRRPKGRWWGELLETISLDQCAALRAFLVHVRSAFLRSDQGPFWITAAEALISEAETFWDTRIPSLTTRIKR